MGSDICVASGTWQYDVAATASADSVLASDCRAQFGRPSTINMEGMSHLCDSTVVSPAAQRETIWQANANTPVSVTPPLLNVPDFCDMHDGLLVETNFEALR